MLLPDVKRLSKDVSTLNSMGISQRLRSCRTSREWAIRFLDLVAYGKVFRLRDLRLIYQTLPPQSWGWSTLSRRIRELAEWGLITRWSYIASGAEDLVWATHEERETFPTAALTMPKRRYKPTKPAPSLIRGGTSVRRLGILSGGS